MSIVNSVLMAALLGGALGSPAQTTAPAATSGTQSSAPAAIDPAASGAQAASAATANSAARGTQNSTGSGAANSGNRRQASGASRNSPGSRGPAGTPAPIATAIVSVTGDANGDGKPDESAKLPGVATFRNGIPSGTQIQVRLLTAVDSGHARNGDTVHGVLLTPVGDAPAGAPVDLTVVAAAAAGQIGSAGELSLQVVRINGAAVLSEVVTATGQEGKKELPDAAPERGTEAVFKTDKPLTLPAS